LRAFGVDIKQSPLFGVVHIVPIEDWILSKPQDSKRGSTKPIIAT